eukprot:gene12444-biopygen10997
MSIIPMGGVFVDLLFSDSSPPGTRSRAHTPFAYDAGILSYGRCVRHAPAAFSSIRVACKVTGGITSTGGCTGDHGAPSCPIPPDERNKHQRPGRPDARRLGLWGLSWSLPRGGTVCPARGHCPGLVPPELWHCRRQRHAFRRRQ